MKKLTLLAVALALSLQAAAQTPAQQYVNKLQRSGVLKTAVWGIKAVDRDGNIVAEYNSGKKLVPASDIKLVTTGVAMNHFGADSRFTTEIGYTGTITDGILEGDVYIIGHGDPTIGAKDSIATNLDALFGRWKFLLKAQGITAIHGRIIGDGSAYEGNLEHQSWGYDDIGTYYGTGTNGLSFYQNTIDLAVSAAAQGQQVNATQTYPDTPWIHMSNHSVTGPEGTGNSLYLYTTDLAPYAELRGSFATDRKPKTEHFANKFGALTCAYYFRNYLEANGLPVTGTYADIDRSGYIRTPDFAPTQKRGEPVIIGQTKSPELKDIARITNVRSDNFYAEAMFRAMGEQNTGIALYDSCIVVQKKVLQQLGLDPSGVRQVDGSGLSRMNYVSPEWMVEFLNAMQRSDVFQPFLASLPHPGEGTLSALLPKLEGRERIRIKSGSMDGVLCYSGYILDSDGTPKITLSIMTNNTDAPAKEVRAALARFLSLLME